MKVFIDADGCPVVNIAVRLSEKYKKECIIVCDTSHLFNIEGVKCITVSKGADSADFRLVNMLSKGDVAVTQDYGLAAMCLARGAVPINQNGLVYNETNIDELLFARYVSGKIRASGGHTKGPPKRTAQQNDEFEKSFEDLLKKEGNL